LKDYQFFQVYFLVLSFCTDYQKPGAEFIERILTYEYKHEIIGLLSSLHLSQNSRRKIERQEAKIQNVAETLAWERQLRSSWPTIVDDNTIFHCLERYRCGSVWEPPLICDLSPLHVTDPFILNHEQFEYGIDVIDGLMLEPRGFKEQSMKGITLQICCECHFALKKNKVLCLALANGLYRGKLPDQFNDLTWIEEMICAKYRNTAHITHIYQSSDPSQPKVFHGNTCAHDMVVVSTASVLPRTPADINGMLSVIFIGPGKFQLNNLGLSFRIRKAKVCHFTLAEISQPFVCRYSFR
jgi:hypothetical protein